VRDLGLLILRLTSESPSPPPPEVQLRRPDPRLSGRPLLPTRPDQGSASSGLHETQMCEPTHPQLSSPVLR
jgi:hypothetical protein